MNEHFFRHEYGRLVALLVRRMGVQHLQTIEDSVQSALMTAVESWGRTGAPENPSAWLFRVAQNNVLGEFRQIKRRLRHIEDLTRQDEQPSAPGGNAPLSDDLRDSLLHMLFVCCDERIPLESQIALALKTLCGFEVNEIAHRLFTSEANVYKRLARARLQLREHPLPIGELTRAQCGARLPAVSKVLYLLFNEGYLSSSGDTAIRRELCDEAIRLATALAEHPVGQNPETFALLALMNFHAARLTSRADVTGGLILLEEQDRGLWDADRIAIGLEWLTKSAQGDIFSRYHAEAGIAAEHCLAPSFKETRWDKIADYYEMLEQIAPNALHRLNRAVAVAEARGPQAGLVLLEDFQPPAGLANSYLWPAVLGDLHRRSGNAGVAEKYNNAALCLAPTPAIREVLKRRIRMN